MATNQFEVTYSSGFKETVNSTCATEEEMCNQVFGMGVDAAAELGCSAKLTEVLVPDIAPEVEIEITEFEASNPAKCHTTPDGIGKIKDGDNLRITVSGGSLDKVNGYEFIVSDVNTTDNTFTIPVDLTEAFPIGLTGVGAIVLPVEPYVPPAPAPAPVEPPAPAPAPAPTAPVSPPWTLRNIISLNPVIATLDDAAGLAQGDYLVFTVLEGSQAQKDALDGKSGQIQSLSGTSVQIGYDGSLAGDATGLVLTAVKQ